MFKRASLLALVLALCWTTSAHAAPHIDGGFCGASNGIWWSQGAAPYKVYRANGNGVTWASDVEQNVAYPNMTVFLDTDRNVPQAQGLRYQVRDSSGASSNYAYCFADEFDGTALKPGWYAPYDSPSHHWRPQQVSVHDGYLDIDCARDPLDGYHWCSGINAGRGWKHTFGRYEVRARFDAGRGISDALMVWPTGDACDWPPEIDFSESGNSWSTTRTGYSGFYHYRNPGCGQDGFVALGQAPTVDYTQWHTIGVEWSAGRLVYTMDGQAWATSTDSHIAQFNAIKGELVLQAQSNNGSPSTDLTTPDHVHLQFDWAHIFALDP
jgi:hypothetical protein